MQRFPFRGGGRALVGAAALATGLLVGPLTAGHVGATFSTCDTDPRVLLSNGVKIEITASFNDAPVDVSSVVYTVEAPAGTSISRVVYPRRTYDLNESVVLLANQADHNYTTHTVVTTGTPGVTVSSRSTLTARASKHVSSGSASGLSGDDLAVALSDQ